MRITVILLILAGTIGVAVALVWLAIQIIKGLGNRGDSESPDVHPDG